MSNWTQHLLRSAIDITEQGAVAVLYFAGHTLKAKEIGQSVQGIVHGRDAAGRTFELLEETLVGVSQASG